MDLRSSYMNYLECITIDPGIRGGKPCIRGTRILVSSILSQLGAGYDFARIREGYPELSDEQIRAAVYYARTGQAAAAPA